MSHGHPLFLLIFSKNMGLAFGKDILGNNNREYLIHMRIDCSIAAELS